MIGLLRSEFLRLFTTRLWQLGPVAALICALIVGLTALLGPENLDPSMAGIDTAEGALSTLSMLGLTVIVPALFGTTAVTAEYRHQTITYTFLFEPRRHRVLTAKLVAYAVVGAGYGLILGALSLLMLQGAALVRGVELGGDAATYLEALARLVTVMTAYTVLGVGVGALLRNQAVALGVFGLYLYMIDNTLVLIPGVNVVYPFLPGGATASLINLTLLSDAGGEISGVPVTLLPPPLGGAVLLLYALAAAVAAVALPMRRDVT